MSSHYERITEVDPDVEAHRRGQRPHALASLSPEERERFRDMLVAESLVTGKIIASAKSLDGLRAEIARTAERNHPVRIAFGPSNSVVYPDKARAEAEVVGQSRTSAKRAS